MSFPFSILLVVILLLSLSVSGNTECGITCKDKLIIINLIINDNDRRNYISFLSKTKSSMKRMIKCYLAYLVTVVGLVSVLVHFSAEENINCMGWCKESPEITRI